MKKTNLWKQIMAVMLVGVLAVGLVGCGGKGPSNSNSNANNGGTSKTDDSIVDLDGYEFTLASQFIQDAPDIENIMGSERSFEEARRYVEETYNCKITVKYFEPTIENIRAKVLSGDKIADVIHIPINYLLQSIRAGYVQSLDSVEGIYTDDYRWVDACTNMATYDGVAYGVNFMRPSEVRTCLLYNREILKECGVEEDLEGLVNNKEWTFDKFEEIAKKCTKDTDGDGVVDIWGVYAAIFNELGISLINSNGGSLVKVEDGVAKENFNSEEAVTALNYLSKWLNEDKIIANVYGSESRLNFTTQEYANYFANGECAFMFCESWLDTQYLKKVAGDLDFGMLPLPMGPDAEDYVSTAYNALVFAIPSTNTDDLDKTVTIMNALAKAVAGEETEDDTAYDYDIMMDYFQKDDMESVDMYKFILSKSYIDLGAGIDTMLSEFSSKCIVDACYKNVGTPAAAVESMSGMFQDIIDSVYNNK